MMPNYMKADQFFYPHGVRRGGYLELVDGKLLTIQVIALPQDL